MMTSSMPTNSRHGRERRNFPRVAYRTTAELEAASGRWPVQLVDLSFSGALVVSAVRCSINLNEEITLHVNLHDQGRIKMRGHLAHVQGNYLGIECSPAGVDNRSKLRKLFSVARQAN